MAAAAAAAAAVDAAHPTGEWHALQDTFYRKHRLYQMQWAELDLSKFRIAAASFGGPIALLRDARQLVEAGAAPVLDSAIRVYSASGQSIGTIECEGAHIAGFSWNNREELVCVQEDGNVRVFSLSGRDPLSFSLGPEARDLGIVACRFWDQGLVAMTSDFRFISVPDLAEPKPRLLADPRLAQAPHCWEAVPPHLTLSRHVEVLVAAGATVLSVDAAGVQDQLLDQGPYACISVSPNGRLAALCSGHGRIQVVSTDFQRSFSEYARAEAEAPAGIAWCGSDAVVASFAREALLVGPFGDAVEFAHDSAVHLVQELDGVRMFNGSVHEALARVGDEAQSVFQIGSTSPAALLFDAADAMRDHASHADEIVRSIRDDMPQAVDTCVAAAGAEPLVEIQQQLLRAAALGKAFLPAYNGDKLTDMCRNLRVLNALGSYAVGIPASLTQFQSLPLEEWVARLLNRNLHRLALQVCRYMDAPSGQVYVHWACAKIRASTLDDDALYRVLLNKLGAAPPTAVPSYVEVAEVANRCGYRRLAVRLLHHEPRAASQVPLLLSMGQDDAAMHAAVRSGDADLVYFVVFHLFKALPLADFFHALGRTPVAGRLFERYCVLTGSPVLEDYYFQNDAFGRSAHLAIIGSLAEQDPARAVASLKAAHKMLLKDKTRSIEARAAEQQIRLVQTQQQLGPGYIGCTLNETLAKCLADGNYSRASKLHTEFRVPERRYAWLRLRALVARRDWAELARMASASRKSPIGFRPFVDECIAALQFQEAAKYILRCEPRDHAPLFLRIGFYREAADAAAKAKDLDTLRQVHAAARDLSLQHHVSQLIEQLTRA
ncbi:Vacuolar protein sorting-associated protein 16 [Coemansia spiralis]|nr:Vacuolar protein sorting-associated protein 16 [Coemansia spiralis]